MAKKMNDKERKEHENRLIAVATRILAAYITTGEGAASPEAALSLAEKVIQGAKDKVSSQA